MTGSPFWWLWLIAFGATLLLEAPIVLWLLRGVEKSLSRRVVLLIAANLATHPLVWFFFRELPLRRLDRLLLSEAWAFLAEGLLYGLLATGGARPRLRRSLVRGALVSLLANGFSWGLGTQLYPLLVAALRG